MTGQQNEPEVLIIGAGIVGLLVAQGLTKEGIRCTVYESEPSATHYRPKEWGMSVQWGLPLLRECFTQEKFDKIYTTSVDPSVVPDDPGYLPTFNGATGEKITDLPLLRMYRVSRGRFRAFCAEGINIVYGKALRDIAYNEDPKTVTAHFENGSTATGTLLIGADGTHSPTRHAIFGHDKSKAAAQPVPFYALNYHVCFNDAEKTHLIRQHHPIMYHGIHPKGYWLFIAVQEVPDPEKQDTVMFQIQTTWRDTTEGEQTTEELADLSRHFKRAETFGEPFRSANLWLPPDTKLGVNKVSHWMPQKWDTRDGRVALAGDAGHSMTFHRGQGLNHGIADAANLTKLLRSVKEGIKDQRTAIDEYMSEMVERAGEEVKMSLGNTEAIHDWSRFTQSPLFKQGGHANKGNTVALQEQRFQETEGEAAK